MPSLIAPFGAGLIAASLWAGPADVDLPPPPPKPIDAETENDETAGQSQETQPVDPEVAAAEAKDQEFEGKLDEARAAVEAKKYLEAAGLLEAAYRLIPTRKVLLDWATAERYAERCDRAIFLYERFLDSIAKEVSAGNEQALSKAETAREGRAKCRESMEGKAASAPVLIIPPPIASKPEPKPAPTEDAGDDTPSPTVLQPDTDRRSPVDKKSQRRNDPAHAWKDPIGWSLFGTGLFALVGSGAMFAVAYTGEPDPLTSPSHSAYLDAVDRSRNLEIGGWTFVGIGSALVVSGIVRIAYVSARAKQGQPRRQATWLSGFGRF